MINTLLEALIDTGAKGIQLHFRPSDNGKVDAIIMMERGNGIVRNDKLKSALAQPLVFQCSSADMATMLPQELGQFVESFKTSLALSNVGDVEKAHIDGQASANKQIKATPIKASEKSGAVQPSQANSKVNEPIEVDEDDSELF